MRKIVLKYLAAVSLSLSPSSSFSPSRRATRNSAFSSRRNAQKRDIHSDIYKIVLILDGSDDARTIVKYPDRGS